jgi:methylenetetrahydrofolate dehydrogenase (NADP+)/methenyltetrahydrofolate cyclohydrolase
MTAQLLDGKALAQRLQQQLKQQLQASQHPRPPGLAVIIVGNNPASQVYVAHKQKACATVGIASRGFALPEQTTQAELLHLIAQLNADDQIDGILVQLPLPAHFSTWEITQAIDPKKDVDGFHAINLGSLALRQPQLRPCTPKGVMRLLSEYQIDLKGKNVTIIGASNIVGRPMALECLLAGATVTVCHRFSKNLKQFIEQAEVLISATGKPGLIDSAWLTPGVIVCDIGITRLADGRLVGDLDFDGAQAKAAFITPVPGGIGPMTVAMLLDNTYQSFCQRQPKQSGGTTWPKPTPL